MKKALVVGINKYPKFPLKGCVYDATLFSEILKTNGDGSPNFDVNLKTNIQSKVELNELIKELFCGDCDAALFYFSGHGSDDGCLVTPDYNSYDMGVRFSDVLEIANKSKCKNKMIVLDSCFSGKMGEVTSALKDNLSVLGDGLTIMTASRKYETSVEIEEEKQAQGLFTKLFVEGLRGSAADLTGKITPAAIYAFIDQCLGAWEQRPVFKTNISHFISIRDVVPKVPKNVLRNLSVYFKSQSDQYKLDPSFEPTNNLEIKHNVIEPYTDNHNVEIFQNLQLFESVGLIEPVDEDHMYFAAMKNKSCKLTALGLHYWRLSKDLRF